MGKIKAVQSIVLPIASIEVNKGQIEGLPANPRLIRDNRFKKLKESIQENPEMLSLRELLVFEHSGKYVIIGGNMRYRAMKELGYTEIACKVIPPETPVEALKAYTIKDNAGFGEWDIDMLANEWDPEDLVNWCVDIPGFDAEIKEEEAEEDNFNIDDNLPKTAKSKTGDIYRLGGHRLICGDSTDPVVIENLMGGKAADLLITDPPYNVNYEGGTSKKLKIENDKMSSSEFQDFLFMSFQNGNSALKNGGAFYIWHSSSENYNFTTSCMQVGWKVRQTLIWNKNILVLGRQDYQWKHEPCLYGWKDGSAHYFCKDRNLTTIFEDKPDIESMTKTDLKAALKEILQSNIPTTVIEENKPNRSAEHPTIKPLKLIGRLIRNSSRSGELVLDLFGGSGSTMMAAEQLGRICYMIELDPCYCDVIIKRWEELTGQTAEFERNIFESENKDKILI